MTYLNDSLPAEPQATHAVRHGQTADPIAEGPLIAILLAVSCTPRLFRSLVAVLLDNRFQPRFKHFSVIPPKSSIHSVYFCQA